MTVAGPMGLRELIETAFADVPYPGDDNIADHEDCPECDAVRAYFRNKNWRDLRFPELSDFHDSLPLLTEDAFHYFLPGYMLAALSDWSLVDMIPYSIVQIGGYHDDAWNVKDEGCENRKRFTQLQREAIAAWLRELVASENPDWHGDTSVEYAVQQILEN